jgi:hypothetical protein
VNSKQQTNPTKQERIRMNSINLNSPAIDLVAQSFGLQESTTQRQRANGTRSFSDPDVLGSDSQPVQYTLHRNGYVRRITGSSPSERYQLNPKVRASESNGITRRLATSTDEVIGMFVKGVVNYRNF